MNSKRIDERLLMFSVKVLRLLEQFPTSLTARSMAGQLVRSAMSVGANYEEATGAESRADFIHKMQIALKEARETCYWLRLAQEYGIIESARIAPVYDEACQIRAMLTSAVVTAKRNG